MKEKNGITLIALIVTIVVLLILAGVSISMLTGDNGIISKAKEAKKENNIGSVKEEINIAFSSIKTKAISKDYVITVNDIINSESEYALEKEIEFEWVDRNSNPALIKKNNIYCYIYDDLSFDVSETDETYAINANLENYTLSNSRTRIVKDSQYQTQIIFNKFYQMNKITILQGDIDITSEVYNEENKTITINKMIDNIDINITSIIEKNNIEALVNKIDENCKYTTIEEIANDPEFLNKLITNTEGINYILSSNEILKSITSNAKIFTKIANNTNTIKTFCENQNARTAMYDNYNITEGIISGSSTALNAMTSSSRYALVNVSMGNTDNADVTVYNGKCFVFSSSQSFHTGTTSGHKNYKVNHGLYLKGDSKLQVTAGGANCNKNGTGINVNKFASKCVMNCSYASGSQYFYARIFKI